MKILLTGPRGFIGSAFTRLALSRGHEVAGLSVPSEVLPPGLAAGRDLVWLRGTLDDAPWKEIESFAPEICIHTAWVTAPGVYLESPDNFRFLESSIRFLQKVQQLATRHVIGLGTCIEYEIGNQPLSEDHTPVAPTTTYARCKNDLRIRMEQEASGKGFGFCWARVFYPYGPREHPSRLCTSIIQKIARGEKIVLKTPDSTKDYIFITDLAAALLAVAEAKFQGPINLGTGIGITVRQIATTLAEMMGRTELIGEVSPPEADPLGFVVADVSKIHGLGWKPDYDLRAGLEKLLNNLHGV
jgi:nucleoside-diphosphate-sugar epimerase